MFSYVQDQAMSLFKETSGTSKRIKVNKNNNLKYDKTKYKSSKFLFRFGRMKFKVDDLANVHLDFIQILEYNDHIIFEFDDDPDITDHVQISNKKFEKEQLIQTVLLFKMMTYIYWYKPVQLDQAWIIGVIALFLIILTNLLNHYLKWYPFDQDNNNNINIPIDPMNICLPALLRDKQGFQLFAQYMIDEGSSEYLWFLVELLQIKYEYQSKHDNRLRLPFKSNTGTISSSHLMDTYLYNDDKEYKWVEFLDSKQTNGSYHTYFFKADGDIDGAIQLPIS